MSLGQGFLGVLRISRVTIIPLTLPPHASLTTDAVQS